MRKRKWDLDEKGQNVPLPVDDQKAVASAMDIASKINAAIAAKVSLEHTRAREAPKVLEPRQEPSLVKSLGLDCEEDKTVRRPLAEFGKLRQIIDINDSRNRYYLTKPSTQAELEEEYGVTVVTRGKYYPDRKMATEREPALSIEVHARTQDKLDEAAAKIKELKDCGAMASIRKEITMKYPTGLDLAVNYHYRSKIMGPQGSYLKHIQTQANCRIVQLRGRGSGYIEPGGFKEDDSEEPYIYLAAYRQEDLDAAVRLCEDLLSTVKSEKISDSASAAQYPPQLVPYGPAGYYYGYPATAYPPHTSSAYAYPPIPQKKDPVHDYKETPPPPSLYKNT